MSESKSSLSDPEWIVACRTNELRPGDALRIDGERPIAVFNVDGEFYAIDDTCTHETASLADGYIEGDIVECPFHFAKFCIRTGAALVYPAVEPVASYPVSVVSDEVLVHRTSVPR